MTQWQEPNGQPSAPPAVDSAVSPSRADRSRRSRVARRQRWLLGLAAALIAAVVVLGLVVVLGGSGGSTRPAKGSPEAFTDQVAAALQARSAPKLGTLACAPSKATVLRSARRVLAGPVRAERQGSVQVREQLAVGRIRLRSSGRPDVIATIALHHQTGAWCLQLLSAAVPTT